jgi:hypothetical protein
MDGVVRYSVRQIILIPLVARSRGQASNGELERTRIQLLCLCFYRYRQQCSSIDNRVRVWLWLNVTSHQTTRQGRLQLSCQLPPPTSGVHSRTPLGRLFRMALPVAKLRRLLLTPHHPLFQKSVLFHLGQRRLAENASSPVHGVNAGPLPQLAPMSLLGPQHLSDRAPPCIAICRSI